MNPPDTSPRSHKTQMQCMEIWGGNNQLDKACHAPGLELSVISNPIPGSTHGGDVVYASQCASGRITRLILADVSGHGDVVSDVAENLRGLMRRNINVIRQTNFIGSMNRQFDQAKSNDTFATAVVMTFFQPTKSLQLCNAGHPPPLHYSTKHQEWTFLEQPSGENSTAMDIPLGILESTHYTPSNITLSVGDIIICYSDALMECSMPDGAMLGTGGLLEIARTLDATDCPETLSHELIEKVKRCCNTQLDQDDTTVISFKVNGSHVTLKNNLLSPFKLFGNVADRTALTFGSGS